MKKILVTGGTGYLGQALCDFLHNKDYKVFALGRNKEIGNKLQSRQIEFVPFDLSGSLEKARLPMDIDFVVHSAALSSPWGTYQDFYNSNVLATQNVLDWSIKNNIQRLIHISTPAIYFNFKDRLHIKEEDAITHGVNHYTKTKIQAENLIQEASHSKLETMILRPRAIFGPGDTTLLPRLVRAYKENKLHIFGDGNNLSDLTYIDNVVHAIYLALIADPNACGQDYNISNNEPVKLWEFISSLPEGLGYSSQLKKIPYLLGNTLASLLEGIYLLTQKHGEPPLTRYTLGLLAKSFTMDISKAQKHLNYYPQVTMEEGLKRTISWFKKS